MARKLDCSIQNSNNTIRALKRKRGIRNRSNRVECLLETMQTDANGNESHHHSLNCAAKTNRRTRHSDKGSMQVNAKPDYFLNLGGTRSFDSGQCRPKSPITGKALDNLSPPGKASTEKHLISSPLPQIRSKDVKLRKIFNSVLPKGDVLLVALRKANVFWLGLQSSKIRQDRSQFKNLEDFTAYAINQGSPYDIAEVAQLLAPATDIPAF